MQLPYSVKIPFHPLYIGDLDTTFPIWIQERKYTQLVVLTDTNCKKHCLPYFLGKTGLPSNTPVITVEDGEQNKNLDTCAQVWSSMLQLNLDRKSLLINLGGGVVGDMGGFCAAAFKRGIDFLQVPTTVLAATDAAVGGKTGIDFQYIKNAIGFFKQPAGVLIDPKFFETLSERQLASGFGEILKHALIGDSDLWESIKNTHSLYGQDWAGLLVPSLQVKASIVAQDPEEKGLRALLNFGHTFGHAIESYFLSSAAPLLHGEAIAWGMYLEAHAAVLTGYKLPEYFPDIRDFKQWLLRFYTPIRQNQLDMEALWTWMLNDKKNEQNQVRLALPGPKSGQLQWLAIQRAGWERLWDKLF